MKTTAFQLLCRRGAVRAYSVPSFRQRGDLTSRKLPLAFDYLHPQPSHLLNLTLSGLLPSLSDSGDTTLPSIKQLRRLPAGHHLVYFPPQIPLSQLLPDGTDDLHSPGGPFTRRLWAGGRVRFSDSDSLRLRGDRAVCLESIRDVVVKGKELDEKVIVKIERRMGVVDEGESEDSVRGRLFQENEDEFGDAAIIEDRNIVFMRGKTAEQISHDKERFGAEDRSIRTPADPQFSHIITPTKAALFRFSALTFNAHGIHLDQSYTRGVEGFRNLLVHGPLTLALMLTTIQSRLSTYGLAVRDIQYRNVAPLYVDEEMSICGRKQSDSGAWYVWIEGKNGGLTVRGTVHTGSIIT